MSGICLQWPVFGPYHVARLRAARNLFATRGVDVYGMQTTTSDLLYGSLFDSDRSVPITTAFPDAVFEEVPPRDVYQKVEQTLMRLDPDAVAINSYSFPDALASLHWCRSNKRIAILMTDSTAVDAPRNPVRERLKRSIVRAFNAALVAGTPQTRYVQSLGMPSNVIYTGYDAIDNDWFASRADAVNAAPETADLPVDGPYLLASGRFVPRKNLPMLVEAYARYRELGPSRPWPLVLVGDGPERPRIESLVSQLKLDGVHLVGLQPRENLPAFYARAGCFVLPSLVDQWGLVVNEAMACGLPVLVSDRAGCSEDLVRDGENGFRFDPEDAEILANLMMRMSSGAVDLPSMGRRSREIIAEWGLDRFARGLSSAIDAARACGDRDYPLDSRLILRALRLGARSARSFHAVRD